MASGYKSSIVFVTAAGVESAEYYNDVSTMDDESMVYTQCKVSKGSGEGAVWIVYSAENYGRAGSGRGDAYILYPSACGLVSPGFRIQSAQAFNVTQPCMCLFEHSYYRGNKLATDQTIDDVRKQFPSGEVAGLSSSIVLSGLWQVWTKPGLNGGRQRVDATGRTQEVPLFEDLNDKVESVEMVRAS